MTESRFKPGFVYSDSKDALAGVEYMLNAAGVAAREDGEIKAAPSGWKADWIQNFLIEAEAMDSVFTAYPDSGDGTAVYPIGGITVMVVTDEEAAEAAGIIEPASYIVTFTPNIPEDATEGAD